MKKILTNIIMVLAIVGFDCLSGCNDNGTNKENNQDSIPCFTMSNFDTSYSPCDNFFMYATGGWKKINTLPETEGRWGSFNILGEKNEEKVKQIILDVGTKTYEKGSVEQQISDLYKSAMDSTTCEERGASPLHGFIGQIMSLESSQEFSSFFAYSKLQGINYLFNTMVNVDEKDVRNYIFYIEQGGLTLPDKDYYLNENERYTKLRADYLDYLIKIFSMIGEDSVQAKHDAQAVLKIETQLAGFSMSRTEMRDPEKTYNKLSISQLQTLMPDFDWSQFLSVLNISIDSVVVREPNFLKQANSLLTGIPIEEWFAYFMFHMIKNYTAWLSEDFVKTSFDFFSGKLSGVIQMKPRQKRAVKFINDIFSKPVGKLFVEKYFPESSKKTVELMIEDLRSVYIERIRILDWMTEETKQKAIEKLHAFTYKIGYPDQWKDYSSIDIVSDDIIHNMIAISQFYINDNLQKIGKPVDRKEWGMPPQMVNAYYNPSMNEVVFPAGILQPPFFDPNADICINYGGIIGVIGHEFTHGFDDQGSKYDKDGNLNPWWTEANEKQFNAKTEIIVKQFDKYEPYPDIYVNGKLTLGENIADLGGLTLAYYAMEKHFKENGRPDDIAGFTPEQRFFLGWAQVWASNIRDELGKQLVIVDPHSPAQYRVNGPMSNMQEFRDAWHCGDDSKMVRKDSLQAKIW